MTRSQNWHNLYRLGALAALLAGLLFRRNIGAEVSLFTGMQSIPNTVADWFSLLQSKPFVGLSFLAFFDLINYALVGIVFLALSAAFWQPNKTRTVLALASGFTGIAVSLSSNISLSMLSLSQKFFETAADFQKEALLFSGQSILSGAQPAGGLPGTGVYFSYLLIALAGLAFASLVLPSHRITGIIGLLAAGSDLLYCLTIPFTPGLQTYLMSFGGAMWMFWHILVAFALFRFAKNENKHDPLKQVT